MNSRLVGKPELAWESKATIFLLLGPLQLTVEYLKVKIILEIWQLLNLAYGAVV